MKQISIGILIIILINGQTQASQPIDTYPISFANIQSIYNWAQKLNKVVDTIRQSNDLTDFSSQSLVSEAQQLESQLLNLKTSQLNSKDSIEILKSSFKDVATEFSTDLDLSPTVYMVEINTIFDEIMRMERPGAQSQDNSGKVSAYKTTIQRALDGLDYSIIWATRPFIMSNPAFTVGKISLQKFNTSECGVHYSRQQGLYYFYVQLMLTDMKGFAALQQVYTKMKFLGSDDAEAAQSAIKNFANRLKLHNRKITQLMSLVSQQIFNCPSQTFTQGSQVFELKGFSRIVINNPQRNCGSTSNNCESLHGAGARRTIVYNCTGFKSPLKACISRRVSGITRLFDWFEDNKQICYGHKRSCQRPLKTYGTPSDSCPVCVCSVDVDQYNSFVGYPVSGISLAEQISDISNNMVVTGIKFEIHKNAIYLKIQQRKFSNDLLKYQNGEWKNVASVSSPRNKRGSIIKSLQHNKKAIYLDDIKVPAGYVVTGVRFKMVDNGFMLEVQGTPFDIGTAELNGLNSEWFNATTHPVNPADYKRDRIEIKMDGVTHPYATRGLRFKFDRESNKLIRFTHTGLREDAGQTTIPLLDATRVESLSAMPLSGIGLSYRQNDKYGGYISPSIYTLDLVPYMEMKVMRKECPIGK